MTIVVNLYGGPGTGKSTNAARIFSMLKDEGVNCELVTEYVKGWAWTGRKPVDFDQFYLFGKQSQLESRLFGKVDVMITDSPVTLCAYYAHVYGTPEQALCFRQLLHTYYRMAADQGVYYDHIFLRRLKPYNPSGRFQTEVEAQAIDEDMVRYLDAQKVPYWVAPGSVAGSQEIVEKTLRRLRD